MAQLNSRGTLTRARWDYFERTDGFASIWGSVASGGIGAYFVNNSTGGTALDIYTFSWFASQALPWEIVLCGPPVTGNALAPSEWNLFALSPDHAKPAGSVGMFTALTSAYWTIVRVSNSMQGQQFAPIMGNYWLTLPPGWGVAVGATAPSTGCELSMTVFYQEVLDNIAPAR